LIALSASGWLMVDESWDSAGMGKDERLTAKQFQESGEVEDWRVLAFGASAWFDAPSHTAGAALVGRIADLADSTGRLPDVDLRARGVHVRIVSGSSGLTVADVATARGISAAARDLGLAADPSAVQAVQLAIDALDKPAVMGFWRAALGYEPSGEQDLVDAMRRDPAIWFQQQDQARPLRNRVHIDVARPQALTPAGASAIGGRHIGGAYGVGFADAEGNEADVIPAEPNEEMGEAAETADWRAMFGGMTFYPIASPLRAAELAATVAGLADDAGLPLLIDLRPHGVTIDSGKDLWEEDGFGDLARRVQAAARAKGLTADTTRLRFVQIGIDAVDIPAVRGFWRAVLGYENDPRSELGVTDIYDPRRLNLTILFQQMSASEEARRKQRNRIHVDVYVPDDQARARIDAALAAGGRIAYDAEAPEWWTLADPEGNEVDIAVSVGRAELWRASHADAD
jgi:pterin-4a-carbinolamine dehydratase